MGGYMKYMPSFIRSEEQPKSQTILQLWKEAQAMVEYALDAGLKVPPRFLGTIEEFKDSGWLSPPVMGSSLTSSNTNESRPAGGGNKEIKDRQVLYQLVRVHNQLAEIVLPATPTSILYLAEERGRGKWLPALFPRSLSITRSMAIFGVLSLIIFCVLLAFPNTFGDEKGQLSPFFDVLRSLVAAALGASFLQLYQANTYIVARTFDPKYMSSYYFRFILGLMAGIIIAYLVPGLEGAGPGGGFTKPILALLGGFSASLVYRILFRLVDAAESIVRGETKDLVDAQVQQEKARLTEQATRDRLQVAGEVVELRQQLASGDAQKAGQLADQLMDRMLPKQEDDEKINP
jgi:hypothetical protein